MNEVLAGAGGTVQLTFYDANGDPVDPGAVTATVKDSAGVEIAGSPFGTTGTSTRSFTLPVTLAVLDVYSVTWNVPDGSKRYSAFEMVGGFVFTLADLRAFDAELTEAAYSDARVRAAREYVQEVFEDESVTGVAFRPRGRRAKRDGTDTTDLVLPDPLPRSVVSAKVDDVALTAAELADLVLYRHGKVRRKSGRWSAGIGNVEVFYEHGHAERPAPINEAALRLARHVLVRSGMASDRATVQFTEIGAFRLSVAGRDGWTGLPEVDAVLKQYAWARATIGGLA